MKRKSAWLFIAVMGLAAACSDDEQKNSITSDEAAAIVAVSLSSNGVNSVSSMSAEYASDAMDGNIGGRVATCGFSETVDYKTNSDPGSINAFNFDFEYKFELTCEGELPAALAVKMNYNGDFSSTNYSYDCSGLANLQLDGLHSDASAFEMNGEYKYDGSFVDNEQKRTISSNVAMTLTDISISKAEHVIKSGKGSYSISGSVPSKGSFKYSGEITFLGAGKAEVSVNGVVYVTDLNIGTATKK
ncbi:hypothetical protein WBG78_00065 [Chryseolinea sp. T2]|uniref:hypothetical protein n=1 Tax=Chryseolinea sp. T2 TaxID=3129255 RepID=UPI0030774E34